MSRAIIRSNNPVQQRLVEIGRCYKGGRKGTSTKGRFAGGDDYESPYFRFEPSDRLKYTPANLEGYTNLYEELKAAWEELIAQGSIRIRFPYSTIEENYVWSNKVVKEIGGTTKTFRECDGVTCTKWVESVPHPTIKGKTIPQFKRGAMPCSAIEGKECPEGCQAKGMLKFMVPELYAGGIVLFPLNSPIDVGAIRAYLEPYRNFDLSAIPFSLFRMEADVSWEEKGEIKTKKNWGLHLQLDPQVARLMMQGSEKRYMAQLGEGNFTPARSLPPTTRALPPAEKPLMMLGQTEDGYLIEQRVHDAILRRDLTALNEILSDARDLVYSGLYDRSSHHWIDREEKRALEMISVGGYAEPPKPKQSSPVKQRLKVVAKHTGHSWDEVRAIAQTLLGRDATQQPPTSDEAEQIRNELLIGWAYKHHRILRDDAEESLGKAIALHDSDEEIWAEFKVTIEAIAQAQSGEPESVSAQAEIAI
jgi:hypothetical protein